ncbi:hypothetical protein LDL08_35575 [Nonomuraea glycinis]|uniref:hypothetical protein n=1 Tax=Nonomuraea glycinis TaxID=2047744 RepID=UPI001CDA1FD5|nr:hypothetical protein [Nonomuraea glycinis]MCA2181495.1 hypothetical protein [Nonomuraea glycinis]
MGLEVERTELVQAEDDFRLAVLGYDLAVGDRVEVLDAGFLGGVIGVAGGLPGLYALKQDALLAEQDPQALVADVVDHPLCDQEVGQLGQDPSRKRQAVLSVGLDLAIFLISRRSGRLKVLGRPPLYFG